MLQYFIKVWFLLGSRIHSWEKVRAVTSPYLVGQVAIVVCFFFLAYTIFSKQWHATTAEYMLVICLQILEPGISKISFTDSVRLYLSIWRIEKDHHLHSLSSRIPGKAKAESEDLIIVVIK